MGLGHRRPFLGPPGKRHRQYSGTACPPPPSLIPISVGGLRGAGTREFHPDPGHGGEAVQLADTAEIQPVQVGEDGTGHPLQLCRQRRTPPSGLLGHGHGHPTPDGCPPGASAERGRRVWYFGQSGGDGRRTPICQHRTAPTSAEYAVVISPLISLQVFHYLCDFNFCINTGFA